MASVRVLRNAGLGVFVCALILASGTAGAGITGICPDGSIFIVQRAAAIPCTGAKRVEPNEVPPLRPEQLPRPYTWEVYEQSKDPRNPYHMIDAAREVRALRGSQAGHAQPGQGAVQEGEAPRATRSADLSPRSLGIGEEELRDLFLIVELSQRGAPAAFLKQTADGRELLTVSLARSRAFESRFHELLPVGRGTSPVLLFSAVAARGEAFHAMFSFVQGHLAFHPDPDDPEQFGILQGRLGDLAAGEAVLGYLVLPASMDVSQSVDVYWNDRRIEAVFSEGT